MPGRKERGQLELFVTGTLRDLIPIDHVLGVWTSISIRAGLDQFLQETSVVQSLLNSALSGVGVTLQNEFSPLGVVVLIQNQQIKPRLAEVQSSLALLQNLQMGTLAVSGLGLGVSAAGFAVMLKCVGFRNLHRGTATSTVPGRGIGARVA